FTKNFRYGNVRLNKFLNNLKYMRMNRDQNGWIAQYKEKGALWIHDGNTKRPHALLTSGNHSNGFFNSRLVIDDEPLLLEAAHDLLSTFEAEEGDIFLVDVVVGPQTGATKLAQLVSGLIEKKTTIACQSASPAKNESGEIKTMVFSEE